MSCSKGCSLALNWGFCGYAHPKQSQLFYCVFLILFYFVEVCNSQWQHGDNALSTVEDTEVPQRIQRMFGKYFSISLYQIFCFSTWHFFPGISVHKNR